MAQRLQAQRTNAEHPGKAAEHPVVFPELLNPQPTSEAKFISCTRVLSVVDPKKNRPKHGIIGVLPRRISAFCWAPTRSISTSSSRTPGGFGGFHPFEFARLKGFAVDPPKP